MVRKLGERRLPAAPKSAPGVDRPYFDPSGQLQWNGSPAQGGPACPQGSAELQRRVLALSPRVDEVRCQGGEAWLVGVGAEGKVAWKRRLGFVSGRHVLDESVLGAARTGIVLSNLTVVAPETGETRLAPPTHAIAGEDRRVPDVELAHAAIFLPSRSAFAVFDADVSLLRREGGLFLLEPRGQSRTLLQPVATTLLGGHWRVEEMAVSEDGRYLLLAQRLALRGPGGVGFAVFDLDERRTVLEERFGEGKWVRDPRLVVGPSGSVGFSYLDESPGQVVLVHYRLTPPS